MARRLTQAQVRKRLSYDQKTGHLTWLDGQDKGKRAGHLNSVGYVTITFGPNKYLAHRVIWLWMTGVWPDFEIDHKDRRRANNSWNNLRPATRTQQNGNWPLLKSNKSGVRGVCFHGSRGKWRAQLQHRRKQIYLGLFDTKAQAAAAYRAMATKIFGEFLP